MLTDTLSASPQLAPGQAGSRRTRAEHAILRTRRGVQVPLGFVRQGDTVFLVARAREALWPTEILREGKATLELPDGRFEGRARLLTEPKERARALAGFESKYGPVLYERWYARPSRVLEVVDTPRAAAREDPARVGWPPDGPDTYYPWIEAEFDNIAAEYDQHILGNRMNRLLRDRSLLRLRSIFAGAGSLLEIGCGSGMETLPLLREGHEVMAVDISERMLDEVRRKARREGLLERLRTRKLLARELSRLQGEIGEGTFDGAYSTYGAFNCEPDLTPIPPALYALLRPGAQFFTGIYNRWCLFELLGYGLTGQWGRAVGRRQRPMPVGSSRFCVDVYAYAPGDLAWAFHSYFSPGPVEGVPVLLPPSDLSGYAEKFASRFEVLDRWDRWLGARWPWDHLGDHFLMAFTRRERPLP